MPKSPIAIGIDLVIAIAVLLYLSLRERRRERQSISGIRHIGPARDWICMCENPWGPGRMLNGPQIQRCEFCGMLAPWLTYERKAS